MSLKRIDSNIKLIVTNAAKLNGRIHETAVLIAAHAKEHGDCTRALTLVNAMPASMRRAMLIEWFRLFTPIRVNLSAKAKTPVGMLKNGQKGYVPFDVEAGNAKPFYEIAKDTPEAEDLTVDGVNEAIAALIKRLTKRVDDGKVAANDADAVTKRIADLKVLAA